MSSWNASSAVAGGFRDVGAVPGPGLLRGNLGNLEFLGFRV